MLIPLATLNQLLIHTKVSENVNVYILNYVWYDVDYTSELNTFKLIWDLQEHVQRQVLPYIQRVNSLLQQAVSTCEAAIVTPVCRQPMEVKESIASGKKSEHQWRFKPTSETPGRKKNGLVLRYALSSFPHSSLHFIYFRHADSGERNKILTKLDSQKVT